MKMVNKSQEIEFECVLKGQSPDQSPDDVQTSDVSPVTPLEVESMSPMPINVEDVTLAEKPSFSLRTKRIGRFGVFLIVVGVLIMGRFSVPDNEVKCVEDKVQTVLQFANDFINKAGNETWRSVFQASCSMLVDIVFLSTFAFWIMKGGSRLPLTLAIFYVIRALVQKIWYSPFPDGFYWSDPGVPSLVVPYGRGSDFFYSGHAGFLIICAKEMHMAGKLKFRNFNLVVVAYTILILLIYRIHYSIDIFAGVFFADWVFFRVDSIKDKVDALWLKITLRIKKMFTRKTRVKQNDQVLEDEESLSKREAQP